jgi:hypothetical protein
MFIHTTTQTHTQLNNHRQQQKLDTMCTIFIYNVILLFPGG